MSAPITEDCAASVGPMALMARETRVRHAMVADSIGGISVETGRNLLIGDEFLLREEGLACHYRKGDGITVQLDDAARAGALDLFLAGSVYSAVAAINGFLPLHASAVMLDGKAIAFTGAPGAGKSTAAAALQARGLPIVADDTLVLDLSGAQAMCLPGHKRLKLWPDALALTGMAARDLVSPEYRKFYATDAGSEVASPVPLAAIVALEVGPALTLAPVRGAERLAILDDDHYTAYLHHAAHGHDAAHRMRSLATLAGSVAMFRHARPMTAETFAASVDFLLNELSRTNLP